MLKEIRNTPERGKFYSYLQVLEHNDLENAVRSIRSIYRSKVRSTKKLIDKAMKPIYGRPIYFKECNTGDMIVSVGELCEETGCDTKEIAETINEYLNRKVCFFRDMGDKRVPVELERIKQAYLSVKEGKSVEEIDNILYTDKDSLHTAT